MPGSILLASPGGTSPRTIKSDPVFNHPIIEAQTAKHQLRMTEDSNEYREEDQCQETLTMEESKETPWEEALINTTKEGPTVRGGTTITKEGTTSMLEEDKKESKGEATTTTKEDYRDEDGREAVITACMNRMPGSRLQASQGGRCPRTAINNIITNITIVEDQKPTWVPGCKEEDNKRYRELLKYMEDRRLEARELLRRDEDRKKEAKQKKDSWDLLRTSMEYLKEKEWGWRQRRIEEIERIREEEKRDRLAVVKEKKKR